MKLKQVKEKKKALRAKRKQYERKMNDSGLGNSGGSNTSKVGINLLLKFCNEDFSDRHL